MKLDYKILWLDDKIEEIQEDQYDLEIKTHLEGLGFNPILEMVSNEKDFFELLDDSYDLILTDYHLNQAGDKVRDGDVIVTEVRGKSIFTEIMFYSAQGEVVDTIKLDRITFVDTKKITGSGHMVKVLKKAIDLINLTIRKFQNIVAMRGMIMHQTSSLDAKMMDIFKGFIGNDQIFPSELKSTIFDGILDHFRKKTKLVEELSQKLNFAKLVTDNYVFSADFKIKTLSEIAKNLNLKDFADEYQSEINTMRNKFAHAELLKDEMGREYFKYGKDGLTFDDSLCKKIRLDISKHKENLDRFAEEISKRFS